MIDWSKYPNFSEAEFICHHTGFVRMDEDFLDRLQALRTKCGFPFKITSGYRHKTHPVEADKTKAGAHSLGKAADIAIAGENALQLIAYAYELGFRRVGVSQSGSARFIHLDTASKEDGFNNSIWSY